MHANCTQCGHGYETKVEVSSCPVCGELTRVGLKVQNPKPANVNWKWILLGSACVFFALFLLCGIFGAIQGRTSIADSEVFSAFRSVEVRREEPDFPISKMALYALKDDLDRNRFRQLCKLMKKQIEDDSFFYIVLFDDEKNAAFPNSPFSSMYGTEEEKVRHIVATFECNTINGFSEVTFYDPNMLQGKAFREPL